MTATLIALPERDLTDLPRALRRLADSIEAGEYGDAHNLAWVLDCGGGRVELGLLGAAAQPGAEGHLLLALGMRKLEYGAME